jgi:putative tryptophan/tyrosine transport system substrate-binding protein
VTTRRTFITLLGGAAVWPLAARAQQAAARHVRVGLITPTPLTPAMLSAFRDGMHERGYVEGQNLSIAVRWPQGPFEQNPGLVAELVSSNVDVIVAWATPSVVAVRRATSTIPIVMVSIGDPLGSGFVASLARPGGNITGVSNITVDLSAKLVGLLIEFVSDMKRVGVVHNPFNPNATMQLRQTEETIRKLGLQAHVVEAYTSEEYERSFARLSGESVKGVVLLADPSVIEQRLRIAEVAQAARLPTAFQLRENVEAGGLLSYGANINSQFQLAAFYVDRILRGAKPADLPVQEPTKIELVINLKTAKALGLSVPPTLLATADEMIE